MSRSNLVSLRRSLASLCGLFILLAAAHVLAAKPRVGVPVFQGHAEGAVRAKVIKALKANGYQIVGGKQLKATASSAGADLDSNDGFAKVAKELAISAFVTGDIGKKKATLTVRNGSDGFVLGEASFNGANPAKIKAAVATGFWRRLGSAVSKGTPPSGAKAKTVVAEEAEPADTEDSKGSGGESSESSSESKESSSDGDNDSSKNDESASEERKPAPRRSKEPARHADAESSEGEGGGLKALELGVGAEAFWRNLTPHDDPQQSLSTNRISPGGAAVLWLEAYPGAFGSTGIASQIGVVGGLEKGLGISSKTADGLKLSTSYLAFDVGLKFRIPLGGAVPFVAATYGKQSYKLSAPAGGARPSGVLDVDYAYIAGTLGSTFLLAPSFNLDVSASYLAVTNPGAQIKADFKNAKAYAVDLGVSAVYYVTPIIGVRAGLDFRQYGLDFKVRSANDPIIVGGATDRYVRFWAGLEVAFDGAGGAASEEAPAPAPKKAPAKPAASDE